MHSAHVPDRLAGKLVVTALLIAGCAALVMTTRHHDVPYFMVDELVSGLAASSGREVRVNGWVVPGSIVETTIDGEPHRTFVLQRSGKLVRVFNHGPDCGTRPRDQAEIIVLGRVQPASRLWPLAALLRVNPAGEQPWVLDATALQMKCPSKYDGARTDDTWPPARRPVPAFE
jgi:cytochrome c-type biogenesis protein CcmE